MAISTLFVSAKMGGNYLIVPRSRQRTVSNRQIHSDRFYPHILLSDPQGRIKKKTGGISFIGYNDYKSFKILISLIKICILL